MRIISLIFREIRFRWINFLISTLAVIASVAFVVTFFTVGSASNRETTKLMLSMGFNIHIIPKDTLMPQFLLTGLTDKTMPQEYLNILATQRGFSYNHLLATLQKKITWQGMDVILTGLAPEVCPPGQQKPPMIYKIEPGTAYLGYKVKTQTGIKKGDTIEILGTEFIVAACLSEQGDTDDIRIQLHIDDAQKILNMPGQISEIRAVDCLCFADTEDPVEILRSEINSVLPDAQVFQLKNIAQARAKQRVMVKKYFTFVMPFVIIVCAAWVGALAMMNVRDRKSEIGILRALGHSSPVIASLFLSRAVIIGLMGAVLGFIAGNMIAMKYGPGIFVITAESLKPIYPLLVWSIVLAPVFAAVASFIPAMIAVVQDPADTLREA